MTEALVVGVVLMVGLALIIYGSIAKTKWGINFSPPKNCPKCNEKLQMVRAPKGSEEALWGGFTCQGCGTKMDKWGRLKE
jgi:hypothetical protein